ncbi:MAG: hypothetical protein B7Y47_02665 [Sphingomonas sp. 28-63-12]|nr:MAG: hypothetical protein B7Y47_02665 [Sphingomonas sp. 28-63-12]
MHRLVALFMLAALVAMSMGMALGAPAFAAGHVSVMPHAPSPDRSCNDRVAMTCDACCLAVPAILGGATEQARPGIDFAAAVISPQIGRVVAPALPPPRRGARS